MRFDVTAEGRCCGEIASWYRPGVRALTAARAARKARRREPWGDRVLLRVCHPFMPHREVVDCRDPSLLIPSRDLREGE